MKKIISLSLGLFMIFGFASTASADLVFSGGNVGYDVVADNAPPIVDAGPDKTIVTPIDYTSVTGTAIDPDGTITNVSWFFTYGPVTPVITSPSSYTTSITGLTALGDYYFTFSALDNDSGFDFDAMKVTVTNTAGSPSGSISASSCTIPNNGSTCPSSVSWSTSNLSANPTEVTHNNPSTTSVSNATSGTNVPSTINYGTTTFYLYHNGVELDNSVATASCAPSSTWDINTSTCQPNSTPSGTLSVATCSIPLNSQDCPSSVSWSTSNLSANPTSITRNIGNPASFTPSPLASGSQPVTLGIGNTTFYLEHNSATLAQATVNVVCQSGSWDGVKCSSAPTPITGWLKANDHKINAGDSTFLTWDTNADSCSGIGFPTANEASHLSPDVIVTPTANTTYTINCTKGTENASFSDTVLIKRKFLFIEF